MSSLTSVLGRGIRVLIVTHGNSWGVRCRRKEDYRVKGLNQFKVRVEEVSQERWGVGSDFRKEYQHFLDGQCSKVEVIWLRDFQGFNNCRVYH